MSQASAKRSASILIDDHPYEVEAGRNCLEIALELGFDLPYFCWHPALGSVGACRQCAVKLFTGGGTTGKPPGEKLVMACMTPATDGLRISIADEGATSFRKAVIEWLMLNHPHDCPICDEGGECHLQDMTVMTGHTSRRTRYRKRTYRSQYLGPFVHHEMNRCIACYRCVRFYGDYAGGRDLNVFGAHDHVYFGRQEDGVLQSEFSGNLVEVCPTGVFTDRTLRKHYVRKWDLATAPSVCAHCSVGCNTYPGERAAVLRRILNRFHPELNGYFLCDRGRFGYEFVNSDQRIQVPMRRADRDSPLSALSPEEARKELEEALLNSGHPSRTIGIGSPRASLESNFTLRSRVGPERFFSGLSEQDSKLLSTCVTVLREGPVPSATLQDAERADAILVLGEDLTNRAARLALSVRQAKGPLHLLTSTPDPLEEIAAQRVQASPEQLERIGFELSLLLQGSSERSEAPDSPVHRIAQSLLASKRPLIISGVGTRSEAMIHSASNIAWALARAGKKARLYFVLPEANSLGLALLDGLPLEAAFDAMYRGEIDTVIVLENDLHRRAKRKDVESFLRRAKRVILIDHSMTGMTRYADWILPAASFAESHGTWVNSEGRAQRFYAVFPPVPSRQESCRESWRWLWLGQIDELHKTMESELPSLSGVSQASTPASFRIANQKIPRQSHRASGRTALFAHKTVHEPRPASDPDSPFTYSMEGYEGTPPPPVVPRPWAPGWNSAQASLFKGAPTGKRLIEPKIPDSGIFFRPQAASQAPPSRAPGKNRLHVLPLYFLFGSEELSALSPSIAERIPRLQAAIHPKDAERIGIQEGGLLDFSLPGEEPKSIPIRIDSRMLPGTLGIPVGFPGTAAAAGTESELVILPAVCEIHPRGIAGAA